MMKPWVPEKYLICVYNFDKGRTDIIDTRTKQIVSYAFTHMAAVQETNRLYKIEREQHDGQHQTIHG